jgi:hypothetical protein
MFSWYQKSTVCYAYLSDVSDLAHHLTGPSDIEPEFSSSRWFTRGWNSFPVIGATCTRSTTHVADCISKLTGIATAYLTGEQSLASASVACKMSWLSPPKTTTVGTEAAAVNDSSASLYGHVTQRVGSIIGSYFRQLRPLFA